MAGGGKGSVKGIRRATMAKRVVRLAEPSNEGAPCIMRQKSLGGNQQSEPTSTSTSTIVNLLDNAPHHTNHDPILPRISPSIPPSIRLRNPNTLPLRVGTHQQTLAYNLADQPHLSKPNSLNPREAGRSSEAISSPGIAAARNPEAFSGGRLGGSDLEYKSIEIEIEPKKYRVERSGLGKISSYPRRVGDFGMESHAQTIDHRALVTDF